MVEEIPDPVPGGGEVIVAVAAAGVGLVDILKRRDGLGGTSSGHILGGEVAGAIVSVGVGVDPALIGQRVFAHGAGGGYAEQFRIHASRVVHIPEGLSFDDAIALGVNALVAHFALETAHLRNGERVLVRGASGGIGFYAVQLAHRKGGRVTAITAKTDSARLQQAGADTILNREKGETQSKDFDVIIDPVAGDSIVTFIGELARRGRYVQLGAAAGFPPPDFGMSLIANFAKSPTFSIFSMASLSDADSATAFSNLSAMALSGGIDLPSRISYRLEDADRAHAHFENGLAFEKIVLCVVA